MPRRTRGHCQLAPDRKTPLSTARNHFWPSELSSRPLGTAEEAHRGARSLEISGTLVGQGQWIVQDHLDAMTNGSVGRRTFMQLSDVAVVVVMCFGSVQCDSRCSCGAEQSAAYE